MRPVEQPVKRAPMEGLTQLLTQLASRKLTQLLDVSRRRSTGSSGFDATSPPSHARTRRLRRQMARRPSTTVRAAQPRHREIPARRRRLPGGQPSPSSGVTRCGAWPSGTSAPGRGSSRSSRSIGMCVKAMGARSSRPTPSIQGGAYVCQPTPARYTHPRRRQRPMSWKPVTRCGPSRRSTWATDRTSTSHAHMAPPFDALARAVRSATSHVLPQDTARFLQTTVEDLRRVLDEDGCADSLAARVGGGADDAWAGAVVVDPVCDQRVPSWQSIASSRRKVLASGK